MLEAGIADWTRCSSTFARLECGICGGDGKEGGYCEDKVWEELCL